MKRAFSLISALVLLSLYLSAQSVVQLPEPDKSGGKPLLDCLAERHSSREYRDEALSLQQLSNLLWAADGINRPESGKRTAPNSRNKQEIDIYIATKDGLFLYDHVNHSLVAVLEEDIRKSTGKQDFVEVAAVNLIYVANYKRIGSSSEEYKTTSCINTGLIVQNVYLYCASSGLGSVCRGYFDGDALHELMQLGEGEEVILTQTVGVVK